MAYAEVSQLVDRWRPLSPEEQRTAELLLEDAAAILDANGYGESDGQLLSIASCNMVRRAMTTDGDAFGVDGQIAPSMGWASSLPAGALWLSRQEKAMLRTGGARIGTAPMAYLDGKA